MWEVPRGPSRVDMVLGRAGRGTTQSVETTEDAGSREPASQVSCSPQVPEDKARLREERL